MKYFAFLSCFLFGLANAAPPNVLFIAVDDLNCRLGCYGFDHIVSPNIDKLAKRGVRFDRAYCQYPSCGPSRASVLSGQRPDTTGIVSNKINFREHLPDALTLPHHFRNNGYHVARVGKIYHQDNPTHIGTGGPDDPESWDEVINPRGRDKDEEDQLTVYTPQLPLPDQMCYLKAEGADFEQTDGKVTDEAIRLLKQKREKPLFIGMGYYRPHIPYIAPKKYFDLYAYEKTLLPGLPENYRSKVPSPALASTPEWPNFGTTEREARECILAYDASVSFVDAQVGRLLNFLEESGQADNTIIVLWGDHGYHLGEHGLWRKNSLFEESMRAPLIVVDPRIASPVSDCERIVEFVDIFPTVAELAGLPIPKGLDGVSLVPLLKNPEAEWEKAAFSQVQFREVNGRAVRTEHWRYVEWGEEGSAGMELYDQVSDSQEMNNLAGKAEHSERIEGLQKLLRSNWPD
jgi:uncharacterized sulfatase